MIYVCVTDLTGVARRHTGHTGDTGETGERGERLTVFS